MPSLFVKHGNEGFELALAGIERKTLAYGRRTLMTEFRLRRGSVLPRHAHPHEQTGCLLRGRLRLSIGDQTWEVFPGDSWCIPGGVEHGAQVLEDSVAIEVFSPVRKDYLPYHEQTHSPPRRPARVRPGGASTRVQPRRRRG